MKFRDYFSERSDYYKSYRPTYPDQLFQYLAQLAPTTECAWDCATGSGQAALKLASHFDRVLATDASREQINQATPHAKIEYSIAAETNAGISDETVDLITVAQALHWFDTAAFFSEAQRVLKPGGILAVWTYNLLRVSPAIDPIIHDFYRHTLNNYWPAERQLVEEGYRSITLPFTEIEPESFQMQHDWNLSQLIGYLGTWSAVKRYESATGNDPLHDLAEPLQQAWGEPGAVKKTNWPLSLRIGAKQI